jgi:hypothetical protein
MREGIKPRNRVRHWVMYARGVMQWVSLNERIQLTTSPQRDGRESTNAAYVVEIRIDWNQNSQRLTGGIFSRAARAGAVYVPTAQRRDILIERENARLQ